ncbi:UDP-N-acetylmuramoylalanine--D-glutamate ligase [Candidatus Gottesmanbacteria bacterium RBG_16_52_11]|uniref:UDP-N-acetylmuramoylalanine--D-glutamate ligase n=1 Tax=Candidatus Gottesmanbacteria bacterium RBG_16_52_11 TaxID=1798374 RepID=A0A1F5YW95_9BACT|nr:MAG: UDP-N-acetylmuramoylalanine--D-glutamate ligase [Candidatus Gottesmanbacteria bacterium RBG_16_52_11]
MKRSDFSGASVAVCGLGVEGISAVRFLTARGARVTILDEKKSVPEMSAVPDIAGLKVQYVHGPMTALLGYDTAVVSPGIRLDRPVFRQARKSGTTITTATNIFMDLAPCPVIGVTGTKGKGTTASLLTEMFKAAGRDAYLGGNIGTPPLDFLDQLDSGSIAVLELSSFQIMNMTRSPETAVILMVTSEHLDYHIDTDEYISAKTNLVTNQGENGLVIVNADYPNSVRAARGARHRIWCLSMKHRVTPGAWTEGEAIFVSDGSATVKVTQCSEIFLPGMHNRENVLAAVAAAYAYGVPADVMRRVIGTFRGLPHRLELVGEIGGVAYYDDSFSTTPETAVAAIKAFDRPKILILGGSSKGSDFSGLGEVINDTPSVRAIIGIGLEWPQIMAKIQNPKAKIIEGCKNMQEIVRTAGSIAEPGDVVLLSPACASFDMFKNYKDRGDQFKANVSAL